MASIVPDLATAWSGKPFTAKDVKCTWDLLTGRSAEKLRRNPRKTWYSNLEEVTANGDDQVAFRPPTAQPRLSH